MGSAYQLILLLLLLESMAEASCGVFSSLRTCLVSGTRNCVHLWTQAVSLILSAFSGILDASVRVSVETAGDVSSN